MFPCFIGPYAIGQSQHPIRRLSSSRQNSPLATLSWSVDLTIKGKIWSSNCVARIALLHHKAPWSTHSSGWTQPSSKGSTVRTWYCIVVTWTVKSFGWGTLSGRLQRVTLWSFWRNILHLEGARRLFASILLVWTPGRRRLDMVQTFGLSWGRSGNGRRIF